MLRIRPVFLDQITLFDPLEHEPGRASRTTGDTELLDSAEFESLNHAFVILDEAQNTTVEQMKMFLTRIGFGAKAVITGDVSQIDLPRTQLSGLIDAERVLKRVTGIAFNRLTSADVVRHPLVARIVDAYDARGGDDDALPPLPKSARRPSVRSSR